MYTIKSLKNGNNALYVKNDEDGVMFVMELLELNGRYSAFPALRIIPLQGGSKIAVYFKNDEAGRGFVVALMTTYGDDGGLDEWYAIGEEEDLIDEEDEEFEEAAVH